MNIVVLTPPAEEPIALEQARAQCRVDVDDDDDLLNGLISAAREYCEAVDWRAYLTQTIQLWLDDWPGGDTIRLPRPPLQSVSSITYFDEDDTGATLDEDAYIVDAISQPGRIVLRAGQSWPSTLLRAANGIVVEYVAGWAAPEYFPYRLKQAQLLLIGHWYENRESVIVGSISKEMEFAVKALLGVDRAFRF